jgi:hypothetical protein
MQNRILYIFLDEAGNFDFSSTGTRYFVLTSVAKERPFLTYRELTELKYDLVEQKMDIEYFHASEDSQVVRTQVFDIIQKNLNGIRVDALIVEKNKTHPALQVEERFYPKMLGYLLKYVMEKQDFGMVTEVIVFTDKIPIQRKRKAVEKAVKSILAEMLPKATRYRLLHHESKSNMDLQIADYCNWAVYRKWARGDKRSYNIIMQVIKTEFDIFQNGTTLYY